METFRLVWENCRRKGFLLSLDGGLSKVLLERIKEDSFNC